MGELLIAEVLRRAAVALQQQGATRPVREAQLKVAITMALDDAALELGQSSRVSRTEYRVALEGFPGVGPADLAIFHGHDPIPDGLVELKWGQNTLWNCVWDVPKLALARRCGAARSAYVVAGAPKREWDSRKRGTELFEWRVRDIGDYMTVYGDLFAFWRKEVNAQPLRLPTPIQTRPAARVELAVAGEPWLLCAAEVTPAGADWSVTFEAGREVGRDRADRFTSFPSDGRWMSPKGPPVAEGIDHPRTERGFWTGTLGADPRHG